MTDQIIMYKCSSPEETPNNSMLVIDVRLYKGLELLYKIRENIRKLAFHQELTIVFENCQLTSDSGKKYTSFEQGCVVIAKAINGLAKIEAIDKDNLSVNVKKLVEMQYDRRWQAGIIFSGNESELPSLSDCISCLRSQSELNEPASIIVCGPPGSIATHVRDKFDIEYLEYSSTYQGGRFLISEKKNYLLKSMNSEKRLILHTRIQLMPDCIRNMPDLFDIITPCIYIRSASNKLIPYLDLCFSSSCLPFLPSRRIVPSIAYPRKKWKNHLRNFFPYIDGGVFAISAQLLNRSLLDENLAWGEAEDVDFCFRHIANGNLIELALDSKAISASMKTKQYYRFGHFPLYIFFRNLIKYARIYFF